MPATSAFSITRRLSSSGRVHFWLPRSGTPKLIMPRQMRETSRPVLPRRVYSMPLTLRPRRGPRQPGGRLRQRRRPPLDRPGDLLGEGGERFGSRPPARARAGPPPGADDAAVADHGGPEHAVAAGHDAVGELGRQRAAAVAVAEDELVEAGQQEHLPG